MIYLWYWPLVKHQLWEEKHVTQSSNLPNYIIYLHNNNLLSLKWFIILSSFNIFQLSGSTLGDSSQYSQYPVNQNSVYDTNYDYSGYQSGEPILLKKKTKTKNRLIPRSPRSCVWKVFTRTLNVPSGIKQLLTDWPLIRGIIEMFSLLVKHLENLNPIQLCTKILWWGGWWWPEREGQKMMESVSKVPSFSSSDMRASSLWSWCPPPPTSSWPCQYWSWGPEDLWSLNSFHVE